MTTLDVRIDDQVCRFSVGERQVEIPVGPGGLARRELTVDPPRPEQLTNAIGVVYDHLDDVLRELPEVLEVDEVRVAGADARAVACVEAGGEVHGSFVLGRDAAEDVFRTLATEARSDRSRNPGLTADRLDTVVAGCCMIVGLMRHLHLDALTVTEAPGRQ